MIVIKIIRNVRIYYTKSKPYVMNQSRSLSYFNIKEIYHSKDCEGSKAEVKGWVKSMRKMKENIFIDLDDGSWPTRLQVVIRKESLPDGLTYGASVVTSGKLVLNPNKQIELVSENIEVIGGCDVTDGFPFFPKKSYPPDYIRQFIHLRPRTGMFSSLLRIRHFAAHALDQYFTDSGFIKIDVPILTSNDCEGAGEVFLVKPDNENLIKEMSSPGINQDEAFFHGKTYLTVSGQLHLEVAARSLGKVYCFGPTFRAENSRSRLHLSEFYMAEAELAFTKSLEDILNVMEGLVKGVCQKLLDTCSKDIYTFDKLYSSNNTLNMEYLLTSPFTVDSYDSVCDLLEKHSQKLDKPFRRGEALGKEHELFLVELNNNTPLFVVDWPANIKPFYMKCHSDNPSKVHAVDLLCANVGELCGGSLREDDFDTLQEKLKRYDQEEKLAWYLELRKFGNVPTGGFGMGFERYLQVILGILNIKDTIPFPRWPHNCKL